MSVPATPAPVPSAPRPKPRRHWGLIAFLILVVVPALGFTLYTLGALSFVYSRGDRAGFVQKFSRKGWLCKTWEGQLAMVNLPGTTPEMFYFTVRNDSIARVINQNIGKRVDVSYEQHSGVPTSCFGDTEYYVVGVHPAAQ